MESLIETLAVLAVTFGGLIIWGYAAVAVTLVIAVLLWLATPFWR